MSHRGPPPNFPADPKGSDSVDRFYGAPSSQRSLEDAIDKINSLKTSLREKHREVEVLRAREKEARTAASTARSQLDSYKAELVGGQERGEDLATMVQDLKARLNEAQLHAQRSDKHIACLEHSLLAAQEERRGIAVLLETRTAELREAQAYLTKVDDVTDRDVLRIVENLNSTIFQTAAKASDAFQARYLDQRSIDAEDAEHRLADSGFGLSTRLLTALRTVDHNDNSVIVQTVVQSVLVRCSQWVCQTWDFGTETNIHKVYAEVRKQEAQSVSGRWRAMSRTYLNKSLGDERVDQSQLAGEVAEKLTDILLTCGVQGPREHLLAEVANVFSESLTEIVRLALEFQRVTGESIVSRDLSAIVAEPGRAFNPELMIDEWADPKRHRRVVQTPPVLCTTQLGLLREETQTGGVGGTSLVVSSAHLLKPHVVLVTMLDDL